MNIENLETIDQILIDYMNRESVDYAYLLSGDWGSGKSFYCNNLLQSYLQDYCVNQKKKKYVVNISLFGRKSLGNIFTEITIKMIGMEKGYNLLDRLSVEEATSVVGNVSSKSWVSSVFSYIGKTLNKNLPSIVHGIGDLDLKRQVLIVFDDLERCEKAELKYLIGKIQTDFIDNGYHVLFVANEKEIKWEEYSTWKEKFIRLTINYSRSISGIVIQLMENRVGEPIYQLYNLDKSRFQHLLNNLSKIRNIRTWLLSIDIYNRVFQEVNLSIDNPYLHNLFIIIVLLSHYNNTNKELLLNKANPFDNKDKTPTVEKEVKKEFGIEYESFPGFFGREWILDSRIHSSRYVFVKMQSLIALLQQGFLDISLFKEEFETSFPWGNEYEIEYSKINDFMAMNEDELVHNVKTVLEGISQRKYRWHQYINIAISLEIMSENGYLSLLNCSDFQQEIIEAVDSIKVDEVISDLSYLNQRYEGAPEYLKPSIHRIIDEMKTKDENRDAFFDFYNSLKSSGTFDLQSPLSELFFCYIQKYGMAQDIISLNGKALSSIDSYVASITRAENCGQIYGNSISPMKYLLGQIQAFLSTTLERSKHYYDLKYFNGLLSSAIKKLEKTAMYDK